MLKFTRYESKKFLCSFLFVCTSIFCSTVHGTDYYVSVSGSDGGDGSAGRPWRSIAKAAASVPAGVHTILVGAGTYEEAAFVLPPGISLRGAGIDRTVIYNATLEWWLGAIRMNSPALTAGNQSVSGFTLDGKNASGFSGIQVINRSNVKIFDVKVQRFYHAGIDLMADYGQKNQNIEIYNFDIRESSRESGGASYGNITSRGSIEGLLIHDGVIYHQSNVPVGPYGENSSGYAIKCSAAWAGSDFSHTDFVSRSKIYNIKEYGKPTAAWGGPGFPNLGIEFWHIGGEEVEIYNCDFTTQISLEYEPPVLRGRYAFWVHDNRFKIGTQQSIELATSNTVIENNVFDYRENTNAWNVMGEYNQHSRGAGNIHVRRNYFLLGDRSPLIWALANPTQDIFFYNNTISGTGSPALFQIRSTSNNVASRNLQVFNNAFDLGGSGTIAAVSYEGGTAQPQGMVLASNHHSKAFSALPSGASQQSNQQVPPALLRSGALALPYLSTGSGSALIDAGRGSLPAAPLPMGFNGSGPDIGAYESGQAAPVPANQNPAVSLTAPASNAAYPAGSSVSVSASATDSDGSIAKVEFFAGTVKIGEKTTAPYTVGWGNVAAGSYQLTAKATDDKGGTATSAPITITVSTQNQMPVASISAPVAGASFIQGTTIAISANASDADGSLSKVEFFANSIKIGEKAAAPYAISWAATATGSYGLTVKVTDNQGGVTTSANVSIVVNPLPGANVLPVISLTSPVANASVTEGGSVTLTANATDADGTISRVEFFAGTSKIGEKTAAPFSITWTNVLKGVYALTAKATDNKGGIATSTATTLNVLAAPTPSAPTTSGTGLRGEFYDIFGTTVANARSAISGKTPNFTFTSASVDYPAGASSTITYTASLNSWLGTDGTGAPSFTLETSIVKLAGFIQIKPEQDVQTGNSTIEVDFMLASQGLAALTVNGKQVILNEANWTFSTQSARVSFPSAGYYPIEIIHNTGWDATGTELYSSIPGTANPGRGTVKTPSLVPKSVLFTTKPSSARTGVSEEMVSQVDSKLVAYPNPSDGSSITFQTDQLKSGKTVVLTFYDMTGRVALQHSVTATDNSVNVQALSLKKGMYTVAINGEGITNRTRVIIQ